MAKKNDDEESGSKKSFWKVVGDFIVKEVSEGMFSSLKETAKETLDNIEKKVHKILHHALKKMTMFFLAVTGLIFVLVGAGKYLSETVGMLGHGLGYVFVGLLVIVLALFAGWMSK
ncbi:MAG: hypothetical protein V1659_05265 [Candidatus Woesearchaeota archaeon]